MNGCESHMQTPEKRMVAGSIPAPPTSEVMSASVLGDTRRLFVGYADSSIEYVRHFRVYLAAGHVDVLRHRRPARAPAGRRRSRRLPRVVDQGGHRVAGSIPA